MLNVLYIFFPSIKQLRTNERVKHFLPVLLGVNWILYCLSLNQNNKNKNEKK